MAKATETLSEVEFLQDLIGRLHDVKRYPLTQRYANVVTIAMYIEKRIKELIKNAK